ncbi:MULTISPECIES: phage tail tube protein [Sphingomonas]|uniref:Phage tail tube protein n=1 Tax=Sphingomonas molluscorum TaxID=418184 RepID=A0ABU8Q7L2_9SPHN|nr:phage tail tube protein [Sphingomonas sp. JUb134]MBM7407056.1 putative secreted protein [Sphingomonas sp. JUb134]
MANEQGKDWRINVKTGANAYAPVGGETSLEWTRSSAEQDQSDKDSGIYGATTYGQQKIAIKVAGNLKLPDAGFTALEAASKLSPPEIEVQIKRGTVIKFQGLIAIGNFSASFPKDGPATYSMDLANAAAPTVDNLSAAAPTA